MSSSEAGGSSLSVGGGKVSNAGRATDAELVSKVEHLPFASLIAVGADGQLFAGSLRWSGIRAYGMVVMLFELCSERVERLTQSLHVALQLLDFRFQGGHAFVALRRGTRRRRRFRSAVHLAT